MEIVCTAILDKPLFTRLHFTESSVTLSQKHVIRGVRVELTTPENTITYHNTLRLSPQNFA